MCFVSPVPGVQRIERWRKIHEEKKRGETVEGEKGFLRSRPILPSLFAPFSRWTSFLPTIWPSRFTIWTPGISYVLSWSSLTLLFCRSVFLLKDLCKGGWSLAKSFFKQNYCHACHTGFVCPLLSSFVLLRTLINVCILFDYVFFRQRSVLVLFTPSRWFSSVFSVLQQHFPWWDFTLFSMSTFWKS